ncbi:glutathione peroxidase [Hoyosella sp. G463]|uniref:Glutathione peroxidase n=1 Tax=Lolliginicoccus lacisalsi TaxID=2742202 RepID=A0A927JB42_9ACTN|nr:glutathione peroxidase [Lolliginicoccus lacisalsi]MBD8505900.1 glutathione peroxidase [Lolliginicoccus lacisalsi]
MSQTVASLPLRTLGGEPTTLADLGPGPYLVVNVASRCGLTPQYQQLEEIAGRYRERGLTVVGVPCNQFGGQEPGTAEEIATFCSTTFGVTFPMLEKTDVNGAQRHPLYEVLAATADDAGEAGDIQWNFEKFLVDARGSVAKRFRPGTMPDDPAVTGAIESLLP